MLPNFKTSIIGIYLNKSISMGKGFIRKIKSYKNCSCSKVECVAVWELVFVPAPEKSKDICLTNMLIKEV